MLGVAPKIPISASTALVVAGGGALLAGAIAAATTSTDGTRNVRRRYDGEYQLRPNSKDAARASIGNQRVLSGVSAVIGGGVLGYQLLNGAGIRGAAIGGILLGAGIGRLAKLSGAEDKIDPSLPEHTPDGTSDMTRHNKYMYQQEGAGYNAYGMYQGPTWGQSSFSPLYQQTSLDRMMPTIPNSFQPGTYLGGNVAPTGPFGLTVPTGMSNVNAQGILNADRFADEQQLLTQLRQEPGALNWSP